MTGHVVLPDSGAALAAAPASPNPPMIELTGIGKSFGAEAPVLRDVSLKVAEGELFTLLGPSGSGKTTVLRIIAGLLAPDSGTVALAGADVTHMPAHERDLAVVFQSLALFPHLTVHDNIAFPLRMRRIARREIGARVHEALELVQLPGIERRRVDELSGGQRQRVALARALVYRPRLLLLDEPLSALDRRLRESMQLELRRLHHELGVTIVNVTHDQREALVLSQRIAIFEQGRIVQIAHGEQLYREPASAFVARFLGDPLLLSGEVVTADGRDELRLPGDVRLAVAPGTPSGPATAVLRPEALDLVRADEAQASEQWDNALPGTIEFGSFDGAGTFYQVALGLGATALVHLPARDRRRRLAPGQRVLVVWRTHDVPIIAGGSER